MKEKRRFRDVAQISTAMIRAREVIADKMKRAEALDMEADSYRGIPSMVDDLHMKRKEASELRASALRSESRLKRLSAKDAEFRTEPLLGIIPDRTVEAL